MEQNSGGEKSAATVTGKPGLGVTTNFNSPGIGQKTKHKDLSTAKVEETNSSVNAVDGYNLKRIYVS